ncbi:MAG: DNA polymerase III subunit delta [Bacteroidota bacterium]
MAALNARDFSQKPQEILRWSGVVLVQGEEPYFIDTIGDCLETRFVPEQARDFNQNVLYGKECDAEQILSAAKLFPFMAEQRLVLVREAQQLAEKEWEKLTGYLQNPLTSTLLVFLYRGKNLDRRKKAYKTLEQKGLVVQSDPLKDKALDAWLDETVIQRGYLLNPKAKALLLEFVGNNPELLASEIEKLSLNLPQGQSIEPEHIEKFVGISREYNVFELQDALGEQDASRALRLAVYLGQQPKASNFSLPLCVGTLYAFYQKVALVHDTQDSNPQALASLLGVHPYFVTAYRKYARSLRPQRIRRCLRILMEYDLKSKGMGQGGLVGEAELTREMITKLLLD